MVRGVVSLGIIEFIRNLNIFCLKTTFIDPFWNISAPSSPSRLTYSTIHLTNHESATWWDLKALSHLVSFHIGTSKTGIANSRTTIQRKWIKSRSFNVNNRLPYVLFGKIRKSSEKWSPIKSYPPLILHIKLYVKIHFS